MPSDRALDRVSRLLDLIPFLSRREVDLNEVSTRLSVPVQQLQQDLEIAFLCGLPGYTPDLLIDISFENEAVFVIDPQVLDKPRAISQHELMSLHLGLDLLAASYSGSQHLIKVIESTKRKLGLRAHLDDVDLMDSEKNDADGYSSSLDIIEQAIMEERRISFSYVDIRGVTTRNRDLSPWQMSWNLGRKMVRGYDHERGAAREFFLLRMHDLQIGVGPWVGPAPSAPLIDEPSRATVRLGRAPMWWRRRNITLIETVSTSGSGVDVTIQYWNRDALLYCLLPISDLVVDVFGDEWTLAQLKQDLLSKFSVQATSTDQDSPLI